MSKKIKISIDAMGGENAPHDVIAGIADAYYKDKDIHFMVFGDTEKVKPLIASYNIPKEVCEFFPTSIAISDNEKPTDALRKSVGSSMREAIEVIKDGKADAFLSCGNTGAMVVISKILLGCLSNIKRPAILGTMPTKKGMSVMIDLGGSIECNTELLFQFALMGNCFARVLLNVAQPTIGILNVGKEDYKGRLLEAELAEILKKSKLNFVGYVEGDEILHGKVDVIVTDGFSGNIALKSIEGTARMFISLLREAIGSSLKSKIAGMMLKPAIKEKIMAQIEPSEHSGAMLAGINGIIVKSHGNSQRKDIANAILVTADLARNKIHDQITKEIKLAERHVQPTKGITKIVDKINKYFQSNPRNNEESTD